MKNRIGSISRKKEIKYILVVFSVVKSLDTDLRIQCLQVIFQTVIDEVHLLHEKEDWKQDITDQFGAITELPAMFANIVSESVQLIKEALVAG